VDRALSPRRRCGGLICRRTSSCPDSYFSGVADWNTYALVATTEDARHDGRNPELPSSPRDAYEDAWRQLVGLGLHELGVADDPTLVTSIIGVIAIGKGQRTLGRLAIAFTEDERKEMIENAGRS
jgi:hypothetical protein